MEAYRVCICGPDPELRSWIAEELELMTWIGELRVRTMVDFDETFDPQAFDLVIAGVDAMSTAQLDRLTTRPWPTFLISVGEARVRADRALPARLTSRELKQVIRELLVQPAPAATL